MRLCYLSHRRPAKAQASLRIRTVSPEPSLFTHMKYGSRRRVRPKIRHLAPLKNELTEDEKCPNLMRWFILYNSTLRGKRNAALAFLKEFVQIKKQFMKWFILYICCKLGHDRLRKSMYFITLFLITLCFKSHNFVARFWTWIHGIWWHPINLTT